MGQHLAWSMCLGICSHAAGICSHTTLIVHTSLVIDAFPSLKHSCPALGMQHNRLPSRSSRSLSNGEVRSHFGDCCVFLQAQSLVLGPMEGLPSCSLQSLWIQKLSWLNEAKIKKLFCNITICGLMSKCTAPKATGLLSCLQMKIVSFRMKQK